MADISRLQPWLVPWARWLIAVAQYNGLHVQVTSTLRSREQQTLLWERYVHCQRVGAGRATCLPAAPPGTSDHELGRAFDLIVDGDYRGAAQAAIGRLWQQMGGRWGGAADPVHFAA